MAEKDFDRFYEVGGVVEYSIFSDASDTDSDHVKALAKALGLGDPETLARITPVEIDEATFHGDWYDPTARKLVWNGHVDARQRPYLSDVESWEARSTAIPPLWTPGGHAYAFVAPPYGLDATGPEIEKLYRKACRRVLPSDRRRILSWHSPGLVRAASRLEIGTRWWGVYVFTVFAELPGYTGMPPQITAIVAATSD